MTARQLFIAAATVAAALGSGSASARADPTAAVCEFDVHLQFQAGTYQTDNSTAQCTGLLDGQLVESGGGVQMWGRYSEATGSSGCGLTWSDGVYTGGILMAIQFIDPDYLPTEGSFQMSSGQPIRVTGSGDDDGQAFVEHGVATFTPDPGQSCLDLRSGTLTQHVVVTGSNGRDAAAVAAINGYEEQQAVAGNGRRTTHPHKRQRYSRRAGHHTRSGKHDRHHN